MVLLKKNTQYSNISTYYIRICRATHNVIHYYYYLYYKGNTIYIKREQFVCHYVLQCALTVDGVI